MPPWDNITNPSGSHKPTLTQPWRVPLQNALKVFPDFPPELMGVVRQTDPATVTQHGLYMRDLSGLSVDAEDFDAQANGTASMSDCMQPSSSELSGYQPLEPCYAHMHQCMHK